MEFCVSPNSYILCGKEREGAHMNIGYVRAIIGTTKKKSLES